MRKPQKYIRREGKIFKICKNQTRKKRRKLDGTMS